METKCRLKLYNFPMLRILFRPQIQYLYYFLFSLVMKQQCTSIMRKGAVANGGLPSSGEVDQR